jgi:hypothetical protein
MPVSSSSLSPHVATPELQEAQDRVEFNTTLNKPLIQALLGALIQDNDKTQVQKVIDEGASVRMDDSYAPLHAAAMLNSREIVGLLLKQGALKDLNKEDLSGSTPLEYALQRGFALEPVLDLDYLPVRTLDENSSKLAKYLFVQGADLTKLPKKVQQAHTTFFEQMLTELVDYFPNGRERMKQRVGLPIPLTDEQEKALKHKMNFTLSKIKAIIQAQIPNLKLEPMIRQCNDILGNTKQDIDSMLKSNDPQRNENVQYLLRDRAYILQTALPLERLDRSKLNQFAQAASQWYEGEALEHAVQAGADSKLLADYQKQLDQAFLELWPEELKEEK